MTSKRRSQIARRNANSAMKSLKHSLNSQTLVLSTESPDKFHDLLDGYISKFKPQDGVEMKLVEEMVSMKWRQQRIWGLQTTALNLEIENGTSDYGGLDMKHWPPEARNAARTATAFTSLANKTNTLELLMRPEANFSRMHDRAIQAIYRMCEEAELQNDPKPEDPPHAPPRVIAIDRLLPRAGFSPATRLERPNPRSRIER